jgi:hypothetical protein
MNLPTVIVLLVIAALMVFAVRCWRGGSGRCGCSSGKCEGCALSSCCCKEEDGARRQGGNPRKPRESCCR